VQDRPTAVELLDAVREFLERDVMPELEGRVQFHTRVAVNALGMIGRELVLGPELDAADIAELRELLGHEGDRRELECELAARIRDGSLDDERAGVVAHLRSSVRRKLEVANPRYLNQSALEQ
jgi:uncharacterized protein DUF6285